MTELVRTIHLKECRKCGLVSSGKAEFERRINDNTILTYKPYCLAMFSVNINSAGSAYHMLNHTIRKKHRFNRTRKRQRSIRAPPEKMTDDFTKEYTES